MFFDPSDVAFVCLLLRSGDQYVYCFHRTNNTAQALSALRPFVGHAVSIAGDPEKPLDRRNRVFTHTQLRIRTLADVRNIDSNPESNPFIAPPLDHGLLLPSELDSSATRTARGTVVAKWQRNKVMLHRADLPPLMVEFRDGTPLPDLDASVEVAGKPETDLYRLYLLRASWRPAADTPPVLVRAVPRAIDDLFRSKGRFVINSQPYGELISIRGILREFVLDEDGERRLLLEEDGLTVQVDCSATPDVVNTLQLGSLVSVTGVCVIEADFWRPSAPFPKVRQLFLVTRTKDDIAVLQNPPWWTPARFLAVLAAMAVILVLIVIWNISLRVLVRRRSREVIRAQERKLESELRIGERTRLAADLHDSLSQSLTVIGYQVSAARKTLGDRDPATRDCLATAAKTIRSCRTELRCCLWDLRNDVLDEPDFATAIRKTVEPVVGEAVLRIRFEGCRTAISDSTAHAILNIVRELASNAVRHGHASEIRIAGEVRANGIRLSVRDNGCGFDVNRRPGQGEGHFGIDGIVERLERLEGTFSVDSAPGKGTYARLTIGRKSP